MKDKEMQQTPSSIFITKNLSLRLLFFAPDLKAHFHTVCWWVCMHFDGLTLLVNFECVLFFKILDNLLLESGKLFLLFP